MASVAEKSMDTTQEGCHAPEANAEQLPPTQHALTKDRLLAKRWVRWAMGAGCVVLILFGLFRSLTLSKQKNPETAVPWNGMVSREENPISSMSRAPNLPADSDFRVSMGIADPTAAKMANTLVSSSSAGPQEGPMIVHTISLTIQVKDVGAARGTLDAILNRYRGYAAQLNINTPENAARTLTATVRIPAAELDATLAELRKLGRVQNESQAAEEVTKQHADLVARLKNARDTEQRLIAILQQRTGKVGDVLQVEEQISNTRGEIERMEAEQKALEHRVEFASVQLQVAEEFKAQLNGQAAVGTRMHNALVNGLGNAGESLLGILLFLEEYGPALLVWGMVLGTPVWLVWRRMRKAESRA